MTDMEVVGMLAEAVLSGDDERTLRVGYEVMIAAEYGEQEGAYELYSELAGQYRAPIPVLMAQLAAIMGHDTSDRLGDVTVPTLVLHGTADRLMEFENGELIARLIPGARLEVLEGSGHMFFWEQPERSAQLVREHAASAATSPSVERGGEAAARLARERVLDAELVEHGDDRLAQALAVFAVGVAGGDLVEQEVEAGFGVARVELGERLADAGRGRRPAARARSARRGRRRRSCRRVAQRARARRRDRPRGSAAARA